MKQNIKLEGNYGQSIQKSNTLEGYVQIPQSI